MLKESEEIYLKEQYSSVSLREKSVREEMKHENAKWVWLEEIRWKPKSSISWLKEGNYTWKFFHEFANMMAKDNSSNKLWVDDRGRIVSPIIDLFSSLYVEPYEKRPWLEDISFSMILENKKKWLERPFLEQEVLEALKCLLEDSNVCWKTKPLPLMGFPMVFFKEFGLL